MGGVSKLGDSIDPSGGGALLSVLGEVTPSVD